MPRRGFTLIELLVVISIIGLLSSVVLASLNAAREKGRIAAGQTFASSLYHAVASETGGYWKFDEGPGSPVVNDASGNGAQGTVNGATFVSDTPTGSGYALSFNGTGNNVAVSTNNRPDLAKVADSSFTMGAWFKSLGRIPQLYGSGYILMRAGYNWAGLRMDNNGSFSGSVSFSDDSYGSVNSGVYIDDARWHYLAMSVNDLAKTITLFVDGREVASGVYSKALKSYTAPSSYFIGGVTDGLVHGIADEVVFFAAALK